MHDARRLHYDLRLELDGVLKSWAITRGPSLDPSQKRLAVQTEDHPVDYITFEGTIPEGHYGAGTVLLWDRGEWEPIGDPREGLNKGKLSFMLHGERLHGRWALVRFKNDKKGKRQNWLLIKERDEEANDRNDIVEKYKTSVVSGRGKTEIVEKPGRTRPGPRSTSRKKEKTAVRSALPDFVEPALATLVDDAPEGREWLFEMKFDGYRALAAVSGEKVRIYTRNGLDWTGRYASLPAAFASLDLDGALIDGEIVVLDGKGRSDFSALQQALKGKGGALSFFAFDLLFEGKKDLRKLPLTERKERLKSLLGSTERKGPIFYTDHVAEDGGEMFETLCRRGFEGMIAKRANAPYRSGRGKNWLKVKCTNEQEFIVAGWSPSSRKRPFSSLLLALRDGKTLRYAGRVGTGFSDEDLESFARDFDKLGRKTPQLDEEEVPAAVRREARWLRPELVVQVGFAEFTRDGLVRQARFLGRREDKNAEDVTVDTPAPVKDVERMTDDPVIDSVHITHPERVLFPEQGITKLELVRYLEKVADLMLPHVENRLVSLVRCPEGRQKKCFFQRHAGAGLGDGFLSMAVEGSEKREDYLYLDGRKGLIAAAQMGVLEFHIWGSRIDAIEKPDRLVFDLDPDPELPFGEVVDAACQTRDVLDALDLQSFPLLTGGKGIHVVAPLTRRHEWPTVKAFARAVAERMADAAPSRFVAVSSKRKRSEKIFIDYLRNDRSATAIAPYSPRARAGAPVAWPVSWNELGKTEATNVMTIGTAFSSRRRDPWKDYGSIRQSLKSAALRKLGVEA